MGTSVAVFAPSVSAKPVARIQTSSIRLHPTKAFAGASGRFTLFRDESTPPRLTFKIVASHVPSTNTAPHKGEAYGVWLLGSHRHFLGFMPPPDANDRLKAIGPRLADQPHFRRWLRQASRIVVTLEDHEPARPGIRVLRGQLHS